MEAKLFNQTQLCLQKLNDENIKLQYWQDSEAEVGKEIEQDDSLKEEKVKTLAEKLRDA